MPQLIGTMMTGGQVNAGAPPGLNRVQPTRLIRAKHQCNQKAWQQPSGTLWWFGQRHFDFGKLDKIWPQIWLGSWWSKIAAGPAQFIHVTHYSPWACKGLNFPFKQSKAPWLVLFWMGEKHSWVMGGYCMERVIFLGSSLHKLRCKVVTGDRFH